MSSPRLRGRSRYYDSLLDAQEDAMWLRFDEPPILSREINRRSRYPSPWPDEPAGQRWSRSFLDPQKDATRLTFDDDVFEDQLSEDEDERGSVHVGQEATVRRKGQEDLCRDSTTERKNTKQTPSSRKAHMQPTSKREGGSVAKDRHGDRDVSQGGGGKGHIEEESLGECPSDPILSTRKKIGDSLTIHDLPARQKGRINKAFNMFAPLEEFDNRVGGREEFDGVGGRREFDSGRT